MVRSLLADPTMGSCTSSLEYTAVVGNGAQSARSAGWFLIKGLEKCTDTRFEGGMGWEGGGATGVMGMI